MMCSAITTNNAARDRGIVNRGSMKGSHECLRPVVPDTPISLCAFHLLLAVQTVDELGGREVVTAIAVEVGQ